MTRRQLGFTVAGMYVIIAMIAVSVVLCTQPVVLPIEPTPTLVVYTATPASVPTPRLAERAPTRTPLPLRDVFTISTLTPTPTALPTVIPPTATPLPPTPTTFVMRG